MKASNLLCFALSLLSWLSVVPASAQMRDQENAAPRKNAALVAEPDAASETPARAVATQSQQLLHDLTNMLQLRPNQVVLVRRALAVSFAAARAQAPAAVVPSPELRALLNETQLAQLQQWESALTEAQRSNLVACAH